MFFFKKAWAIIKVEMIEEIQHLFRASKFNKGINATNLSLIPKVHSPTNMEEYIPISYCNVLHTTISRVLTNRIKLVIPHIVENMENAFIFGRSIQENLLVAHEMVRGYNRRRGEQSVLSN